MALRESLGVTELVEEEVNNDTMVTPSIPKMTISTTT
jgi:hypothetical protein